MINIKKILFKIFLLGVAILFLYSLILANYSNRILSIDYEDNKVIVKFDPKFIGDDVYCILTTQDDVPSFDNDNWVSAYNSECILDFKSESHYNLFIRDNNEVVSSYSSNNGMLFDIELVKDKIYVAVNGKYDIKYNYKAIGIYDEIEYASSNENVFVVNDGVIVGKGVGEANLILKSGNVQDELSVIVTDLITTVPKSYDFDKKQLGCAIHSSDEADLLDEILADRINDAGYKTRAGVVEAARFLTLEFPYRINYFYENGRQTTNNVDGEGRYYHKGLYLHKSDYSNITGSSTGPKMWGCSLYSNPVKRYDKNGLDCSGFVSWALLNGGFDVKDVGAGLSVNSDLTDFGKLTKLTNTIATGESIKVGDLLHSYAAGGHIGIIVGKTTNYYYVAQALWYDEVGVIISKIKRNKLASEFAEVVYMDDYYKEDGNLTDMWY